MLIIEKNSATFHNVAEVNEDSWIYINKDCQNVKEHMVK